MKTWEKFRNATTELKKDHKIKKKQHKMIGEKAVNKNPDIMKGTLPIC